MPALALRRPTTLLAALALAGSSLILLAPGAYACSCRSASVDQTLDAGGTIGIVTRTDPGNGANGDDDLDATFAVHDSLGGDLPPQLTGALGNGSSCVPYIAPQQVAAVGFSRRGTDWVLSGCGTFDLGTALQRAQGDARLTTGGPAVAYAAGAFGGSRLAAVDAGGVAVAFDGRPGAGDRVAVCPDGRTVVASGRTEAEGLADRKHELTVHDATTLRVLRTVELPLDNYGRVHALRCADAAADRVEILTENTEGGSPGRGRLLVVSGSKVRGTTLGTLSAAVATPDGFLAATGAKPTTLSQISPTGTTRVLADLGDIGVETAPMVVAPDGRTVAVFGEGPGDNPVLTFDTATGKKLGEWTTEDAYVTGLAWTASNRLLVRHEKIYRQSPVPLRVFDRTLGQEGEWPAVTGEWGGRLYALGEAAVTTGGTQLTATPEAGAPLIAGDLRLAAATYVVPAAPGAAFAPAAAAPTSSGLPVAAPAEPPSTDTRTYAVLGVAAVLFAGLVLELRRRRSA